MGCTSEYYTESDYKSIKKIDTHMHLHSKNTVLSELAKEDNFSLLDVMVDVPDYPPIEDQEQFALDQVQAFPDRVKYLTAFTLTHWDSASWVNETIAHLKSSFAKGALGIKIWKNIGMVYKDSSDRFIMIDNPRFDPIIQYIIQQNKTVMGHLGEPKNCWLPIEQMTVNNDKNYFKNNPEYHMFLHPEYPSYEEQINARDNFLARHPDLRFVGAHLGSLEYNVDSLAKRLDKFPNMAADMAARISHLQYQSKKDREKVRNFMIKYYDRLIYGSDTGIETDSNSSEIKKQLHDRWINDWKYFATDEIMMAEEVDGEFQGLKLPKRVIEHIYHNNAVKWFRFEE
ncbi:MAG: amidohydrolase family protein [Cyclobacteriaceae bacterium]|nr:amidohydrolase family protein [Cyclobacteriaceae bacterium]